MKIKSTITFFKKCFSLISSFRVNDIVLVKRSVKYKVGISILRDGSMLLLRSLTNRTVSLGNFLFLFITLYKITYVLQFAKYLKINRCVFHCSVNNAIVIRPPSFFFFFLTSTTQSGFKRIFRFLEWIYDFCPADFHRSFQKEFKRASYLLEKIIPLANFLESFEATF